MNFTLNIFQWYGGPRVTWLSIWHIMYLVIIAGAIILMGRRIKKNGNTEAAKEKMLKGIAATILALYLADFFLMPLYRANGNATTQLIDLDKLPFHLCTLMAVLIQFAQFNSKCKKSVWFNEIVTVLSIVAAGIYLVYPGTAFRDIGAFNFTIMQTFLFHGLVLAWAILNITTGRVVLKVKNLWQIAVALVIIVAWAKIGNVVYSYAIPTIKFNWCFLEEAVFSFQTAETMPIYFYVAMVSLSAIVYAINDIVKAIVKKIKQKKIKE